jgi:hypothetical protein
MLAVAALAAAAGVPLAAQQTATIVKGNEIRISGCVGRSAPATRASGTVLVWTRGDLMLSRAVIEGYYPVGTSGVVGPEGVLYYLDKSDQLARHVGKLVEVRGDLKDVETGRVQIDRDGDFTEVKLDLDDREDKVRVPTAWFGSDVRDKEYDVIARKIDVDDVRAIGPCPAQ